MQTLRREVADRKPSKEQKAARPSSVAGISMPSALAVFRLMAGPMPLDVSVGSWLRDNALTRSAPVHDPVNVVRHGRFEQFFLLDDQDLP
jgi:hypothetical protein